MLLAAVEILAMLAFLGGLIAAAFNYLGGSTLHLVLQLLWQGLHIPMVCSFLKLISSRQPQKFSSLRPAGSIKVRGLSCKPVISAQSSALQQPERIGGHTVFKSDTIRVEGGLAHILTGGTAHHACCL